MILLTPLFSSNSTCSLEIVYPNTILLNLYKFSYNDIVDPVHIKLKFQIKSKVKFDIAWLDNNHQWLSLTYKSYITSLTSKIFSYKSYITILQSCWNTAQANIIIFVKVEQIYIKKLVICQYINNMYILHYRFPKSRWICILYYAHTEIRISLEIQLISQWSMFIVNPSSFVDRTCIEGCCFASLLILNVWSVSYSISSIY